MNRFGLMAMLLLGCSGSFAGEQDEMFRAAREAALEAYTRGLEGEASRMSLEHEIWLVELAEYSSPGCESTVTGHVHKPPGNGMTMNKFWVCITRDSDGRYVGELLGDIEIAGE